MDCKVHVSLLIYVDIGVSKEIYLLCKVHFEFCKYSHKHNTNCCILVLLCVCLASFYEAQHHANRKRNRAPAIYNEARLNESPIPVVNHAIEEYAENSSDASNEEEELAIEVDEAPFDVHEMPSSTQNDTEIDVKPVFESVVLDDADASALNDLFAVENFENSIESNETIDSSLVATNNGLESTHNENVASSTTRSTTHKVDDDFEYTYSSDSDFQPISVKAGYQIKANDSLSNNWPFKENVMKTTSFQRTLCIPIHINNVM